jgi:hypothetical protein
MSIPKFEGSMKEYLHDAIYKKCEDKPEYIVDIIVVKYF